jgi:PAS domain S-box-containing protein
LRLLESVVVNASEAILITEADPIGLPGPRIVYVNNAFSCMTGYSLEEVVGKTPRILQGPRTQRAVLDEIRAAITGGEPIRAELINYRKDGSEFWTDLHIVPIRDETGRIAHWAAAKREITERKRVEEALRRSEAMNRALFNAIPDLIFRFSREGVYLDFKPSKEFKPLVPPSEFLGKSVLEVLPPEVAQKCMELLHRTLATGETQIYEYQLLKDGVLRDYEARLVPCGENEVLILVRDITNRKMLEQQLRQASKMEAVGRLAGGVAHDFNNLLTVIGGYAQMLRDSLPPADSLREVVEEIARAADRANALTQRLLSFSRHQVVQPKVLELNSVVSGLNKMLRRVIGADIELATALRPDLARVKVDRSQIEQILVNLIVNARDAMPGGGRLTIETRNVELGEEYARMHVGVVPGQYVMLSVGDTGDGMDEETKSHLFEPFFTTKEPGKGTGLGLSTVYGIAKQSGGDIDVHSEVGKGTTVRVYLPQVEEAGVEVALKTPVRRPLGGTETVLLVEDEVGVRKLFQEILRRHGYTVLEARDSQDAVMIGAEHPGPIHLLLTDVVMPQMSGGELAKRIRGMRPALRVLYVSGYADDASLRREAPDLGGAFLQKPFTPEVLLRTLRDVLDVKEDLS